MKTLDIKKMKISDIQKLFKNKQITPTEVVHTFLEQIEKTDNKVKAWVRVDKEGALEQAKQLEEKYRDKELPPLYAIPFGAKDIFCTKGIPTEAGSNVMKGYVPEEDAAVITRLKKEGAILLGKTTTTEFANWGNPPKTRNPWNLEHTPGGSSSGSAAAMASETALITLGTQTAGSLSRPAAYNGLTALKATYGRVSRAGVIPASLSLDHVGAYTNCVEDAVAVYNAISGPDAKDGTTLPMDKENLVIQENRTYKIGVLTGDYFKGTSSEIKLAIEQAIKTFKEIGYHIKVVPVPDSILAANDAHAVVMQTEVGAYHEAEYQKDMLRFGSYLQQYIKASFNIKANTYLKAQQTRKAFRQEFVQLFKTYEVDLLICPTAPTPAPFGINETGSPIYCLPFTNMGVPTLALPIGFSLEGGLPLGMQLISQPMKEQKLIDVGYLFQKLTHWHLEKPTL